MFRKQLKLRMLQYLKLRMLKFLLLKMFQSWLIKMFKCFDDMNASNEPLQGSQLSADPVPLASGSLPSVEVQLMAQTGQNVNLSSSTIGYVAGASNFLVSDLPTPKTIPSTLL